MAEPSVTCRCHRALGTPPGQHRWPNRDPEPGDRVQVVAIYGEDPTFLRWDRVPGGWQTHGAGACHVAHTPPRPWVEVGRCWADTNHAVVAVTD